MKSQQKHKKIIISGGGTGGHVFPAIAIADAFKREFEDVEILFIGAIGRLEMEKVPEAGYRIIGLPAEGFHRRRFWRNVIVVNKLINCLVKARKIIKEFKPDLAIGVGGYASGPVLWVAARFGIPILIQEQNSCAGVTNKLLARKAGRICVAYEGMEQFFPAEKIILTGNPVREEIISIRSPGKKEEGLKHFGLTDRFRVLLVMGGSLGARTINESVIRGLGEIREAGVQLVWQCGKYYLEEARKALDSSGITSVVMTDFISRVDLAFAVSDVIIARAGAITISELFHAGKPVILVPSPNVAGDHQTKNAMALVNKTAAICIRDHEARDLLVKKALELINNEEMIRKLSDGISGLAIRDSAERIIREAMALIA